jgi:hypothetical protein
MTGDTEHPENEPSNGQPDPVIDLSKPRHRFKTKVWTPPEKPAAPLEQQPVDEEPIDKDPALENPSENHPPPREPLQKRAYKNTIEDEWTDWNSIPEPRKLTTTEYRPEIWEWLGPSLMIIWGWVWPVLIAAVIVFVRTTFTVGLMGYASTPRPISPWIWVVGAGFTIFMVFMNRRQFNRNPEAYFQNLEPGFYYSYSIRRTLLITGMAIAAGLLASYFINN